MMLSRVVGGGCYSKRRRLGELAPPARLAVSPAFGGWCGPLQPPALGAGHTFQSCLASRFILASDLGDITGARLAALSVRLRGLSRVAATFSVTAAVRRYQYVVPGCGTSRA